MKISLDWKAGILPSVRTAGALMVGNAGVTYLLGTTRASIALTMFVAGSTLIALGSLIRRQ